MKKEPWFYNRTFLIDNAKFIKGDVVDVGCGRAKYKDMILGFEGVKNYTGIDFYQTDNVDIIADLNQKIPVDSSKFDTAICISVIEHLPEPQIALSEIYRILKPGGYLLLSTPWIYLYHGEPDDYFRYSRKALEYMLKKSGFKIIKIIPTGGRFRILLIFLQRWFPYLRRVIKIAERFVSETPADGREFLDTPSHQVIAQKI